MGIPHAPAYLEAPEDIRNGVNFGSASSGILITSGRGQVLSLEKQVDDFKEVKARLHANLGEIVSRQILSSSIFYICTGNNDINDFFQENKRSIGITPEFKNRLLLVYRAQLQRLYNLGARKFVVVSVTPVGCVLINQVHGGACDPIAKNAASQINAGLTTMLEQIRPYLPGANLVYCNLFDLWLHVLENPTFMVSQSQTVRVVTQIQQPVISCAFLVANSVNTQIPLLGICLDIVVDATTFVWGISPKTDVSVCLLGWNSPDNSFNSMAAKVFWRGTGCSHRAYKNSKLDSISN